MSIEQENTATDTPEVDEFDQGFSGIESAPTTTPEEIETPEVVEQPAAPKLAQITEEDYQALVKKATAIDEIKAENKRLFDSAFGKIGGMQQLVDQIKASSQSGQPIEISEDDFEELRTEFPELAALSVKGLQRALGKVRGAGAPAAIDPQVIEKMVSDRVAGHSDEVRKQIIDHTLEAVHPGWAEEITTPEFDMWLKAQPGWCPEIAQGGAWQAALQDPNSPLSKFVKENPKSAVACTLSPNIGDAARLIKMYEASKTAAPVPPPRNSARQKILEANVNPVGSGGHAPGPSEDDDFNAGFNG